MTILITGSNGFVGQALVAKLLVIGSQSLRLASREPEKSAYPGSKNISNVAFKILPDFDYQDAVEGCECIVHLAARAHKTRDVTGNPLGEFRAINVVGTLALAKQAVAAKVKRFVFISSIGVNGTETTKPFLETDAPKPEEAYAVSKLEAEVGLQKIAESSDMELVILRPALIYGPNAPGNFGSLISAVAGGIPMPLGATRNNRSLISIANLVDLITVCIHHPSAAGELFLAADGEDLSTTDLLKRLGRAIGRPARLFPVPKTLMVFLLRVLGKGKMAQSLYGNLQIDIAKAKSLLSWTPLGLDEGFNILFGQKTK